jgi:diguanylate cyclase (GGDEF)-like protein/PAS domain S-box-containing protein
MSRSDRERPPRDPAFDEREMAALLISEVQDYAILMLDVDGYVTTWNPGARRFKGYEAEEIIGRHFSVFYPPEAIADGLPERLLAAARTGGRTEDEGWRMRKDGSRFWASVVITALRDETGVLRGYGKVTRDLTERHERELELRTAEDRFRAAFSHAPNGIAIVGLEGTASGRFVELNAALARMLGYESDELVGTVAAAVAHPEDREIAARVRGALAAGETICAEHRFRHRDGREVWALVSSTPLPDGRDDRPRSAISHILDISERKRFESQLRHLADHDVLTGLFNRHRFDAELQRVTGETARLGRAAALLIVDLDGFKHVNDRFGHPVGDELVRRVGEVMRDTVRSSDIVARIGGDEFAVILPEATLAEAEQLAERLLEAIRDRAPVRGHPFAGRITASIGITGFDGDTALSGPELVVEADAAMYEAKSQGRDEFVCHDRVRPRRRIFSDRESWQERLRTAVQEDRFVLHAQPIRGICGDDIPRYELLLRLPDETGDLIAPGGFLQNAERLNLMGEIDRLVLRRAIALLEAHQNAGHDISLSVNVSGRTLNDTELGRELAAVLAEHPIPDGRLVIEVTETAAIADIDRARGLADELRSLGCRLALDDFGSGFASLLYLKHLDFDFLKIDGEFIRQLSRTPTDQLVVRAVVDIARGLDTQTVAEFVGDDPTVELLRDLGIDYGQGYHLGRPGPLEAVLPPLAPPEPVPA